MKKIFFSLIALFFLSLSFQTVWASTIWWTSDTEIPYCNWDDCWLDQWVQQVKDSGIDGVVTEWKASEYVQWITAYILWFLSIIAVLIIIYAWFNLLTSAWDEEKAKKSKTIIIFTILWLVIIYLAGPITTFVVDVLTQGG